MPSGVYKKTEEHGKKIGDANRGKHHTEEAKKKMRGRKSPFYGKHHTEEAKRKVSISNSGENNPMFGKCGIESPTWKGDDVSVEWLHERVRKIKPKPEVCDICHQKIDKNGTIKLQLSNVKNHQYTDDPDDYQWVHPGCHRKYDYG